MFLIEKFFNNNKDYEISCEINSFYFDLFKKFSTYNNFLNLIVMTPHLVIKQYDRFYAQSKKDVYGWSIIFQFLQHYYSLLDSQVLTNNEKYIFGSLFRKVNKLYDFNETKIIETQSFEQFKRNPRQIINRLISKTNRDPKQIEFFSYIFFKSIYLQPYQKMNIVNKLIKTTNSYTNFHLDLIYKKFKQLNSHFFNGKDINPTHFALIARELKQTIDEIERYKPALLNLTYEIEKIIYDEIQFKNWDSANDYLQQYFDVSERNQISKFELYNGMNSYVLKNNYFFQKKQFKKQKQQDKKEKKINRNFLKKCILSLRYNYLITFFKFQSIRKKDNFYYYRKLKLKKIKDLIILYKKLLKLKNLTSLKINWILLQLKNSIDEIYFPVTQQIFSIPIKHNVKNDERLNIIYKTFQQKRGKGFLYNHLSFTEFYVYLFNLNNKNYARKIQEYYFKKWLIRKNYIFLKFSKKQYKKNIIQNNDNTLINNHFYESKEFYKGLKTLSTKSIFFLNLLSSHYKKLSNKTKKVNIFNYARLQLQANMIAHSNIIKLKHSFTNGKGWKHSLFSWFMNMNLIFNNAYEKYKSIYDDYIFQEKIKLINFHSNYYSRFIHIKKFQERFGKYKYVNLINFLRLNEIKNNKFNSIEQNTYLTYDPRNAFDIYKKYMHDRNLKNKIYKKLLKNKIFEINSYRKSIWNSEQKTRKSLIYKNINILKKFKKISKILLKNIDIVNNSAFHSNIVNVKNSLDDSDIKKIYLSNIVILNTYYWFIKFFSIKNKFKLIKQQDKFFNLLNSYQFNKILDSVDIDRLVAFENFLTLSNTDMIRLYLGLQFFVKPKLIIFSNLPIESQHEYNLLKGLLLRGQNNLKYAIIFLNHNEQLSQELATKKLPAID